MTIYLATDTGVVSSILALARKVTHVTSVAVILMICASNSALANWWLVRSSDGTCLVVDIEPTDTDKNVTKIGKDVYQSADEAEADAKRLCKEAKTPDQSGPHAQ